MFTQAVSKQLGTLASVGLSDAYTDFVLSRQACNVEIQAMLGHAGLEMVQHYAQMVDDDLLNAHNAHSPIDNLSRLK